MMLKTLKKFAGIASKSSLIAAGMLCCVSAYALDADAEGMLYNGGAFVLHLDENTVFDAGMAGNYDTVTYSRSIENNFGTLCLPFAYDTTMIDGRVRLYKAGWVRDNAVKLMEVTKVKAGEPVVFYAYDTKTINIKAEGEVMVVEQPIADALFMGTFDTVRVEENANTTFFLKDNKFMKGNESYIVPSFHAAMHKDGENKALKSISILFDDFEEVEVAEMGVIGGKTVTLVGIYNMKGQQVQEMQKNEMYILRMNDGTSRKVMVE